MHLGDDPVLNGRRVGACRVELYSFVRPFFDIKLDRVDNRHPYLILIKRKQIAGGGYLKAKVLCTRERNSSPCALACLA